MKKDQTKQKTFNTKSAKRGKWPADVQKIYDDIKKEDKKKKPTP